MATLIHKKKKGHEYTYWVESKRVNGKPRIVEQVYLGPKQRVLEEIKAAYTRGRAPGPAPLRQVRVLEFGASAWVWYWADKLQLRQIVDRHVSPPDPKRRTPLTVGTYLELAALNRAIDPRSKRAFYRYWYQSSVVSRLCPAREGDLSSQRFWDHMDRVGPEPIEAIQQDVLARLGELFELGEGTLLYDTTNYFSFIDTFNQRTELAQRGWNKQKRTNLRQLSLALFEDEATGLPIYHQCYRGDRPDVSQFETAWEALVRTWVKGLGRPAEQLTLVFDKGNNSKGNLERLGGPEGLRYVGALPGHWVPQLLQVGLADYHKLDLPGSRHLKAYRTRQEYWGRERTLLVVFSPTFYRKQRAVMNRQQKKAGEKIEELAAGIDAWQQTRRGPGYRRESVERKIGDWTARDHLREYLSFELKVEDGRVVKLEWSWDRAKKRKVQRTYLGKTVLITDRDDWEDVQIALAYRKLWKSERLFRMSKDGPWWPMGHWTDSKIQVHALYCYFALLLLAILQKQLEEAGITLRADRAIDQLRMIQETLIIYTNGSADRVLSQRDETQEQLLQALGLPAIAEAMGTTVLKED
jgi:transposase